MPQPKRDAVHKYFAFDASSNSSACNLCGNKMKGKHTSNLKNHLAVKHVNKYNEVVNLNKCREIKGNKEKHNKTDEVLRTLKNLCVQLTTVHWRPLALIDDEPFQKLLHQAASSSPRSKEINEKEVRAIIPEVANDIKLKIAAEIRNKLICLKLDTATRLNRRFLGINIQYIKRDKIIMRNLSVVEVNESQTCEFLTEKVLKVVNEFKISKEQIYSLTTDNGCNMKKMTQLLGGSYCSEDTVAAMNIIVNEHNDNRQNESDGEDCEEENEMSRNLLVARAEDFDSKFVTAQILNNDSERDFKIRGMFCAAHTLQLAVKEAIVENLEVQATLELARKMTKIMRTPKNRKLLKLSKLKVAIIDFPTRWTSTYNMLGRLLALREFSENLSDVARLASPEFWSEVGNIVYCLYPLNECALVLQKEQLTIGDFYINWMKCKNTVGAIHHHFASSLERAIESREKSLLETDIVLESLYLDGRLNLLLSEEQCQKARHLINQTWKQMKRLKERSQAALSEDSQTVSNANLEQPGPSTRESTNPNNSDFSAIEEILIKKETTRGLTQPTMNLFNACLYELRSKPRLPLDTNMISHWCNRTAINNSDITMVANTILATPATHVSVDRLFSSLKLMLSASMGNVSSKLLQNMLLIRWNKDLLQ